MPDAKDSTRKVIATNRKARHDYEIGDTYEAGMALLGSEVKSLRSHGCNLTDGFVAERNGELWLMDVHIAEYGYYTAGLGHEPRRPRKLLMHKKEIARLITRIRERGYTIVPLQMYFKDGRAKVEIALARGKRQYDKRATLAEKDSRRDVERALKERDS
ncbi:MAG: SsrA-binding protein SmpB [Aggregatilineales bacterium]